MVTLDTDEQMCYPSVRTMDVDGLKLSYVHTIPVH